jgi:hypothetical protein
MRELVYYAVHRVDQSIELIGDMDRSPENAWRRYLGRCITGRELERSARKAAMMDGVRCWCYRLSPCGAAPDLGFC